MVDTSEHALRAALARIEAGDRELAHELAALRHDQGGLRDRAISRHRDLELETIVLRVGRPVLSIVDHRPRLEFRDSASEVWRGRLVAAEAGIERATRAVGRINVSGHPELQWVGTGWLVAAETVVTNRHVAREFGRRSDGRFTFAVVDGAAVQPSIDLLAEAGRDDRQELRVVEILHIEDEDGPDLALLRVERSGAAEPVAQPIPLAAQAVKPGAHVAVVGYPARDSRIPDFDLMQKIFGDVYDCKRLAPGQVLESLASVVTHDCSTLGGNSGSVVLDLAHGHAVALHYSGRFLKANRAVPAAVVAERLASLSRPSSLLPIPAEPPSADDDEPADDLFVEASVSDYVGRRGYDPAFMGTDVPAPSVVDASDLLTYETSGRTEHELRYEHFSVAMSRRRRLCLWSAANLDGGRIKRVKRADWRIDPRISAKAQIRGECYGNAPRFSRGHMTRRADPVWGETADASRANADSMHVTNTVPQLQPFNAGIWLGLEDYALDHAVEDAMRIAVFTGPFLLDDDPVKYGVQIPVSFWKVIAFLHDESGALCATGYVMSQQDLLGDQEFVFGRHKTWQVSLASIERKARLSFGRLATLDPLADVDETVSTPLTGFQQITFRRR